MHRTTVLYSLAILLSFMSLSRAQNDTSTSTLEQSETTTSTSEQSETLTSTLLSTDTPSTLLSVDDSTTTLQFTDTKDWSTITFSPAFPTFTPTVADSSSIIPATDTTNHDDDGPITTLGPPGGSTPVTVWHSNGTWNTPPPDGANFPSQPNATDTLSVITNGPVSPCATIQVWWAGGVGPYKIYYMLLDVNQTIEDTAAYTSEYYVSTEWTYGPIRIKQLGKNGKRGLTRIRVEDSTKKNVVTWVSNYVTRFPCVSGVNGGVSTPWQVLSAPLTIKPDLTTTQQPGAVPTTGFIATVDGTQTMIVPTSSIANTPAHRPQPAAGLLPVAPTPATSPSPSPRPTSGLASGSILHGLVSGSGGNNNSGNGGSGEGGRPSGDSSSASINANHSNTINASQSNTVDASHPNTIDTSHSDRNPNGQNANGSATPQGAGSINPNGGVRQVSTSSSSPGNQSIISTGSSSRRRLGVASTESIRVGTLATSSVTSSASSPTTQSQAIGSQSASGVHDIQTTSRLVRSGQSSASVVDQGVASTANSPNSNRNDIVFRFSKPVFAVVVTLLVSAVVACAGYGIFRYNRGKRVHKSESSEHFDPFYSGIA